MEQWPSAANWTVSTLIEFVVIYYTIYYTIESADICLADFIADPSGFILFPLVVHSFDLVVSAIGIASIKGTRDVSSKSLVEDPMIILQKGYSVTLFLAVLAFGGVSISRILNSCNIFLSFVLIAF